MSDLKKKIQAKMATPQLSALATITEDGKPWERYVTPVMHDNMTIWMATFANSRKVAHIKKNPEVHLTMGVTFVETAESYLQIVSRAEILTDATTKEAVWGNHLKGIFTGAGDPNYNVVKITPYRIEYQGMGMVSPEVWEA